MCSPEMGWGEQNEDDWNDDDEGEENAVVMVKVIVTICHFFCCDKMTQPTVAYKGFIFNYASNRRVPQGRKERHGDRKGRWLITFNPHREDSERGGGDQKVGSARILTLRTCPNP